MTHGKQETFQHASHCFLHCNLYIVLQWGVRELFISLVYLDAPMTVEQRS